MYVINLQDTVITDVVTLIYCYCIELQNECDEYV